MAKDPVQRGPLNASQVEDLRERLNTAANARRDFPKSGHRGLSPLEIQTLGALALLGTATPGEVAELLALDKSSVSPAIWGLVDRRLISERVSSVDRRRKELRLLKAGATILSSFLEQRPG